MLEMSRGALLSVRPRFADALLDGSKTAEIRRRRAHIAPGQLCLIYASSPRCALVGAIRVKLTDTDTPDAVWKRWGPSTALDREEFDAYLKGSEASCAIVVESAVELPSPIPLEELRRRRERFVAPQSYRFLAEDELGSLLNGEAGTLAHLRPDLPQPFSTTDLLRPPAKLRSQEARNLAQSDGFLANERQGSVPRPLSP
jgi:predicted transcriptional regulator